METAGSKIMVQGTGCPEHLKKMRQVGSSIWKQPKERTIPHVLVKLCPGKTEKQKTQLAEQITESVMSIFHTREESVSVAFEEVKARTERVYEPDIRAKWNSLYKKPGYEPF